MGMGFKTWGEALLPEVVYFQEGPGLRNWQYRDEGIPFVNIRCLKDGRLMRSEMTCLDPEEVETKYQHFLLDVGDYVVSSSGTLGRLAEVFPEDLPCILNTSVIRFRPLDEGVLDRRFLKAYLRSDLFHSQIRMHASGSAQLNYGPTHLKQMTLPIPPIEEQRAIGQLLGVLDDRIDSLRSQNRVLETIAQALFKSWFVDFDPVRAKAEGREPEGMDAATAALFPDRLEDSLLGPIPAGWRVDRFDREFDFTMGQSPPGSTYNEEGLGTPFFQGSTDFGHVYPSRRAFCTAPTRLAQSGDVLMSVRAPVGAMNIASFNCSIGRGLCAIRHKSGSTGFTEQFLKASVARIENAAGEGAVFKSLSKKQLAELPVVISNANLVNAMGSVLDPLLDRRVASAQQADKLAEVRDTLLPRLISGKLRLPEAEREIEAATT